MKSFPVIPGGEFCFNKMRIAILQMTSVLRYVKFSKHNDMCNLKSKKVSPPPSTLKKVDYGIVNIE